LGLQELFDAARDAAAERAWGAAVQLAREGAVQGTGDDGEEVRLRVKARGRALPHEVYLWPEDLDWGCDCELPGDPCVHVCAAVISLRHGRSKGAALPEPQREYKVELLYAFVSDGDALRLERRVFWPDGRTSLLEKTLSEEKVIASRGDVQAESLLALLPPGPLPAESLRRLLHILEGRPRATLDGHSISLSAEPLLFRVRVTDDGEGFKAGLYRASGVDRWFRGAALVKDTLRPTSHGALTREQRRFLVRGVSFSQDEVNRLVGDYLPRLRERILVEVETSRLPETEQLVPTVEVHLAECVAGLEIKSRVVYGEPPMAVVEQGVLKALGTVVPGRNLAAERIAVRAFEERMGLTVAVRRVLPPERAATFLNEQLPLYDGPVRNRVDPDRFRVDALAVEPALSVREADGGRFALDVTFSSESGSAEPQAVLRAWSTGRPLVPLLEGGYAPLPANWLQSHGAVLREILEARAVDGTVARQSTAALVELLEDTRADVPPDLDKLRAFLEGEEGMPELALPDDFVGELRQYQHTGVRWMGFLRDVDLQGILADDMGLGKTVQALVAMAQTPGPHLVVAPTSVLRNWEREAERFLPGLSVNLYHGPSRALDGAAVTLTSYALLRLDRHILGARDWGYVVLDEAQAIKNPRSQTARAACGLRSGHRLALTGTPVENRLEELWSLFRFLMPGFLGSQQSFRERFSGPIEAGDGPAREGLRRRIRPYVLRRLKSQVARELPPLTEMLIRCEMPEPQRKVYDAVRTAAFRDVRKVLGEDWKKAAAFEVLEALLRMRQACCDPALLPGDHAAAGACKLDELEDLLVELVVEDHKALVFSQWTSLLDRVEPRLVDLGIEWVRLDGSTRNRQQVIDAFQDPGGPPVFLLSLKAGGFGLNLTAADYVVHLDPWWNPAVQQQATDRAHRIGQSKPVVSVRLIAAETVEERIVDLQEAKRNLADAALGTEGGFLRALSVDELRSLFEAG
jgi:superfamily II DNA or RNA helicase